MAIPEAVAVLTKHWARFLAELDETGRKQLRVLAGKLSVAVTDKERRKHWGDVIALATRQLAGASPVRAELDEALDASRFNPGVGLPMLLPVGFPDVTVKPAIDAWILASPSFSAASIRRRGGDPDLPGLIRIRRPNGRVSLPTFQFTRAGDPKPLVLRINQLLGADSDPWGVADWWLCPNVWLAGTPADLLGTLDDRVLVAAAVAAVEG